MLKRRNVFTCLLLGILILTSNIPWAYEIPWDAAPSKPVARRKLETNIFRIFTGGALDLFQQHISHVDGPRCSFRPTCSAYARQSIARYGLGRGIIMAADRLQRCHYCANLYYPWQDGKLIDPPEANVFNNK